MMLVIGYGNTLRGDDGAGPAVAAEVSNRHPAVPVLTPHQLLPEFADIVAHASHVVFVDAAVGGEPGAVTCSPVFADAHSRVDHTLSPASLLRLAREVYGLGPPAWLVRIHGESFDLAPALSPPVASAIPGAVALVQRLISL